MEANDNVKSCAGTLKCQKIGRSSEDKDKNIGKIFIKGKDKVVYIGKKIESF